MLALWGVAPRGGYSEILAWAIPVLAVYRWAIGAGGGPRSRLAQAGWGFLFTLGLFLNPLSLVVYGAIGVDWLFGRHGATLRKQRRLGGGWLDSPLAPAIWAAIGVLFITAMAAACHVELDRMRSQIRFIWLLDVFPEPIGMALGALSLVVLVTIAARWTGAGRQLLCVLDGRMWFGLGALLALIPFPLNSLRIALGYTERGFSLPMWIRAPWDISKNVHDGLYALRPLIGCDPHAAAYSIIGLSLDAPAPHWSGLERMLQIATPWAVALVAALVGTVVWHDRAKWRAWFALRGKSATSPTILAFTGLTCSFALYLLQATSPNSTSIRYLMPVWIFLPGLIAQGLLIWTPLVRWVGGVALLGVWSLAQVQLWAEMDRPSPFRPVAQELEARGVKGFVAATPIVLILADLTAGRLGGLEYHSFWPRVMNRYADRFPPGEPIVCVNDLKYGRPPIEDIGRRLHGLAGRHPYRVNRVWQEGQYEIWIADVPMNEIMDKRLDGSVESNSHERNR
jgi:hypothetical protein